MQLELKTLGEGNLADEAKTNVANLGTLINKSLGTVMTALEYIDEWTEGVADQTRPNQRVSVSDGKNPSGGE